MLLPLSRGRAQRPARPCARSVAWVRLAAAAHIVGDVGVALDDAKRAGVDDGEEQMRRAHEERAPAAGRAAAGADDAAEGQPDQDEAGGAEAGAVEAGLLDAIGTVAPWSLFFALEALAASVPAPSTWNGPAGSPDTSRSDE